MIRTYGTLEGQAYSKDYERQRAPRVTACVRGARTMTFMRKLTPATGDLVRFLPGLKGMQRRFFTRYM